MTSTTSQRARALRAWLLPALCAVAVVLWFAPLRSSFWLDETGTFWVLKDGFGDAVDRAWRFQGQSPLYYLIELGTLRVLGRSEVALRLASTLFAGGAAFYIHRLGRRLFDAETAWLAVLAFAVAGDVRFAAGDARPYALALFACVAATFYLIRWVEDGARKDAALYVAAVCVAVYAHYVFVPLFAAHVAYGLAVRKRRPDALGRVLVPLGIAGVLCLPLAWQLASLWGRGTNLSWIVSTSTAGLAIMMVVPLLLLGGGVLLRRLAPDASMRESLRRDALALLMTWAVAPPIVLYAISVGSDVKLFHPRYLISIAPAIALLLAWTIRGMGVAWMRLAVAVVAGAIAFSSASFDHRNEGWREAIAAANRVTPSASTPVLLSSGFIEGGEVAWLNDPEKRSFLLAPAAYYPLKGRVVAIPYGFSPSLRSVAADIAERETRDGAPVVVITNYRRDFEEPIQARLAPRGYRGRIVGFFGTIVVLAFERG